MENRTKALWAALGLAQCLFWQPALSAVDRAGQDAVGASPKKVFTTQDALALEVLRFSGERGVSFDGEWIAYEVKSGYQTNAKAGTSYYYVPRGFHVFVRSARETRAIQITQGDEHSWSPSWSPDGEKLAFYAWNNGQIRIALWDRQGRSVVYFAAPNLNGKGALDWNPQGDRIYYFPSEFKPPGPVLPYEAVERTIVRTSWEKDPYEQRFTDVRKSQLWALDIKTGGSMALLPEETSIYSHALSPDGQKLAVATLTRGAVLTHLVPSYMRLDILAPTGGPAKSVFQDKPITVPYAWSPDSRLLAYVDEGRLTLWNTADEKATVLNRPEISVTGRPVWDPRGKNILCEAGQTCYLFSLSEEPPRALEFGIPYARDEYLWDKTGNAIYIKVVEETTGRQGLYRFDRRHGKTEQIFLENSLISQLILKNGRPFFTLQNKTTPENIWTVDVRSKKKTRLTETNQAVDGFALGRSELTSWKCLSGDPLRGVLIYPGDYSPGRRYPIIFWVYESFSRDLHRFFTHLYNLQVLTSRGYAVFMPDIKFIPGDTARSFKESVVPAMDQLLEMGIANGNFGVMGWSFGGFATNILITQTTRFKAAVSSCGITDWVSKNSMQGEFWRRGDQIGQGRLGGTLWEVRDNFIKNSPVFHLDKVQTPIMLLHGTEDRNVPFSQAEEMYYSLRDLKKTAVLVAYPGETHLGGDAERWVIIDMWQRILDWFDRYLK